MKKTLAIIIAACACLSAAAQPQVIAHRGFHATDGSCRNSMASLEKAQQLGIYGSECDINMTSDGVLLVLHGGKHPDKNVLKDNPEIKPVDIQKHTAAEVQAIKLENGETVPTFDQYLAQVRKDPKTKLIIEIKSHATPARETEVVQATVAKVAEYGLQDAVEYIAFRPWVCFELKRLAPEGTQIAYLNGDYTPEYVEGMGISGIDYSYKVLMNKKKTKYIKQCHKRGLKVNIWTVNTEEDIRWAIENGVDFITTDDPQLAMRLIEQSRK